MFQDFLDEYPELDFEVDIVNYNYFYIYFFIKHGDEFKEIITKEKYPIPSETLDLLKVKLKQHNCCIENDIIHYHSNKRYIYLDIKRIESITESKNQTNPSYEEGLEKHFNLSSDEIQNWCQDFLDEYPELLFEISVANHNYFTIYFFLTGDQTHYIKEEKYPFPDDVLSFLKERLKAHHCYIEEDKVHHRTRYIFINVRKYRQ